MRPSYDETDEQVFDKGDGHYAIGGAVWALSPTGQTAEKAWPVLKVTTSSHGHARDTQIAIYRKAAVARLDSFIGPEQ